MQPLTYRQSLSPPLYQVPAYVQGYAKHLENTERWAIIVLFIYIYWGLLNFNE